VGNRFEQEKPFTILRTKQKQVQVVFPNPHQLVIHITNVFDSRVILLQILICCYSYRGAVSNCFTLLVHLQPLSFNSTHDLVFIHKQPRGVSTRKKQTFHRFWPQGEKGRVEEHVFGKRVLREKGVYR